MHHLVAQTRLSKQQIRDWFTNTRRRISPRHHSRAQLDQRPPNTIHSAQKCSLSYSSSPRPIPQRVPTPTPSHRLNPLQRWEHSSTEEEAASFSNIYKALNSLPEPSNSPFTLGMLDEPRTSRSVATSQSSAESDSCSSANSRISGFSHSSRGRVGKATPGRKRLAAS